MNLCGGEQGSPFVRLSATAPLSSHQLRDERRLRFLAFWYFALGVLFMSFSCFSPLNFVAFLVVLLYPHNAGYVDLLREVPFWVPGVLFLTLLMVSIVLARLFFIASQCCSQRRNLRLLRLSAWLLVVAFPFGTILGVWALFVLRRPSVRGLFVGG